MNDVVPKFTILNVDDNEISCYTKTHVLRRAGFEVKEVTTGAQALSSIRLEKHPLVLLDVGLPDINGLEVCRLIKSDPTMASTLVLQISASLITSSDRARGLDGGADAYLSEPVEPVELVATVRALLRLREAEATLENQRAFLRQVIDLNPNLIFAKDRRGRFTLANQAVADVYGATVMELVGKTDADFAANPAELEHFQHDDLEVINSHQEKFIPEETITDAAGQVRWLQTVKRPIVGADGLAHQVLGVATDITARKQAQAALTQLNETLEQRVRERTALIQLLQEIAAAANEAVTIEEALQFTLDRICAYMHWPVGHAYWLDRQNPSELISSLIWHLDEPERFEVFRRASEVARLGPGIGLPGRVLARGELTWTAAAPQRLSPGRAEAAADCGLKAGFGFPLWVGQEIVAVLEFYTTVTTAPEGSFMEAMTQVGTQLGRVVERSRAARRIRESEQQLLEAQQIAHLGSWQWDIVNSKLAWSDELYRIYGLVPQSVEMTYEGFLERIHPDDRERVAGLVNVAYQTGQPFDYEYRLIRPDGTLRALHAQGRVILTETGQPLKMVGIGHDITERKEIEEQLRRLNTELEQRVSERTAQLEVANQELAEEISERKQIEAALRQSENQMRLITDAAPALIAYVDAEQRYRFNNRAYETWFGYSPASLFGQHVKESLGRTAYKSLRPHIEAALAGQEVTYEQISPYDTDGTRFIQAHYIPDFGEQGEVRGYVSLVYDLTERKQMEEALRESEARFRNMADHAPVMIWVTEADNACSYLSQSWYEFTGQTPETALGFGWLEAVHPDDRARTEKAVLAAAAKHEAFSLEYRLRSLDGEYRWGLDAASPRLGPQGEFLGHIGSITDINERKRAEMAERLLAETSETLIASTNYETALSNLAHLIVPGLADWVVVDLLGEDDLIHRLEVVHHDPAKAEFAAQLQQHYAILLPQQEHTITKMWQQGRSWYDPEVSEIRLAAEARDPAHLQLLQNLGFASEIVVPLTARGRTLGALTLVRTSQEQHYETADLDLAEELARRAAIAVDNGRLYEAEQRARQNAEQTTERITRLQAVTAALSEALTPAQVTKAIINQGLLDLGADGGMIFLLDEADNQLEVVDSFGYSADVVKTWRRFPILPVRLPASDVVHTGQPIFIESREILQAQYPGIEKLPISNRPGLAALPLKVEERVIGVIGLTFNQARTFNDKEQSFLLALAQQCAQALERARLYEVEQKARIEAQASQQRMALLAESRERNRLAQELHDTVAQALGYLNLKIATTDTLLAGGQLDAAKANLQEVKKVVSETYTDVREEIFHLRAKVLSGLGFMELLDRYIDKYHRFYNLNIELVQQADPALFEFPDEVTPQIIRTIQEALINIRKHAHVDSAIIYLSRENDDVRISIEDQGQGFDPAKIKEKQSSFGLQIMRERVESVGGKLEIDTAPNRGTRIILRFPIA